MSLRQAAQRALKAMEDGEDRADMIEFSEALIALRAALAEPEQKPVAWKLVPVEPTNEMLKAMDECSTEGYDERLLAGHAASVYMAAVDVAPLYTAPIPRKPLTDEEIERACVPLGAAMLSFTEVARAIERAHGIGEQQ
jgi:hypothetical protein